MRLTLLAFALLVAVPLVSALPGICGTDCRIDSAATGYTPVVAIVASGSTVMWSSADITHVTTDQVVGAGEHCFIVYHERGELSAPVRFDIADGALVATVDGTSTKCASAVGNGAGGFALPYFCAIHPSMRAALVVTAV